MDLLFGTYHQENIDVDFCWVSISPEMAEDFLGKLESAKKSQQADKDLSYMAFKSNAPRFYSHSDLEKVGIDDTLLEVASERCVELGHEEVAMIENADDSGDAGWSYRVDSTKIIAWPDGDVVWHGYYPDGHLVESFTITRRQIEEIALDHPKYLLKTLAFAPKNLV